MRQSHDQLTRCLRGFSLVEVLVAVAICAGSVIAVVALFGPTQRGIREAADRRNAIRVVELIESELRRGGFAAIAAATTDDAQLELIARGDGSQAVLTTDADNDPATGSPRGIPPTERYFHIEIARAVRPASEMSCLVLELRVSWPLRLPPDGAVVPEAQRSELHFHTALNR
jgi:type II secretory pathway pseudopilin PulG